MEPTKLFNRLFVGLTLFLSLFYTYNLGLDVGHSDGKEATVDGILAVFWLVSFALFSAMNRASAKMDRDLEESRKKLDKAMGENLKAMHGLMDQMIEEKRNHEMIDAIVKDVVGKGKPATKHCAVITKAIYENVGLYAEVSVNKQGGFDIGLSKEPIQAPAAPVKKKAPAKKPVTKTPKGGK